MTNETETDRERRMTDSRWYDARPFERCTMMKESLRRGTLKDWAVASVTAFSLVAAVSVPLIYFAGKALPIPPRFDVIKEQRAIDLQQYDTNESGLLEQSKLQQIARDYNSLFEGNETGEQNDK